MRKAILLILFSFASATFLLAQSRDAGTEKAAVKHFMKEKGAMASTFGQGATEAVKTVLKQYNNAVSKLDVEGTEKFFVTDSKIVESGGTEGNYAHYLEHHLRPELKEFKSFTYSDYKVEVSVEGSYAFATESYNYTIVLVKDDSKVKRKGVATSVLKKVKGEWKIWISHNSSRR